jgi:hypothetical protein
MNLINILILSLSLSLSLSLLIRRNYENKVLTFWKETIKHRN